MLSAQQQTYFIYETAPLSAPCHADKAANNLQPASRRGGIMSIHTAKHTLPIDTFKQAHNNAAGGLYPKIGNWPEVIWWFGYLPHVSGVK